MASRYAFLVETYATEVLKVLSVWATTREEDLDVRPRVGDPRGRTLREHRIHQCQSEHGWFEGMLGIRSPLPALPASTTNAAFLAHYAAVGTVRERELSAQDDAWWEAEVGFFEVRRPRTWIVVRRIAHTAHHRGQQSALLRAFGRDLYSTYGPTADTGGLAKDTPPVVYPYRSVADLLAGGPLQPLPPRVSRPVTERPDAV